MATRFVRKDFSDGASEILTVVRIDGRNDLAIEICRGPEIGDDFVGLFDFDGDQISTGNNCTWEAAEDVPHDVVREIADNWASGTASVEPL